MNDRCQHFALAKANGFLAYMWIIHVPLYVCTVLNINNNNTYIMPSSTPSQTSVWFTHGTQSLRKPAMSKHMYTRRMTNLTNSKTPMQRLTASARKRPHKPTRVLRLGLPSTAHALRMAGRVHPTTIPTRADETDSEDNTASDCWGRWTHI